MLQRILYLLAGFLLAALAAEILLHALPYSTGYGALGINPEHPIALGTAHRRYTYSRDWTFHFANSGVLNAAGFRASFDYVPDPDALVVIGNSFVQADALRPDLRMTEQLGSRLQRKAYALGIDGFSLADYLAASRWAVQRFHTRTVLVLLTTEDLVRSCQRRPGQHYLRFKEGIVSLELIDRPDPSLAKRALNRSSLFRYLFDNLHAPGNWAKGWRHEDHSAPVTPLVPKAAPVGPPGEGQPDEQPAPAAPSGCASAQFQQAATSYLLQAFRELEQTSGTEVIFILAPDYFQKHTARSGTLGSFRDVDAFANDASRSGFEVVSLGEAFSAATRSGTPLSLMPIDRHWNAAANRIAARTVADFMLTHRYGKASGPEPQ